MNDQISLPEAIESLRQQLSGLADIAPAQGLAFLTKTVEVGFTITASRETSGTLGVKWFVDLSGARSEGSSVEHQLRLTLEPINQGQGTREVFIEADDLS